MQAIYKNVHVWAAEVAVHLIDTNEAMAVEQMAAVPQQIAAWKAAIDANSQRRLSLPSLAEADRSERRKRAQQEAAQAWEALWTALNSSATQAAFVMPAAAVREKGVDGKIRNVSPIEQAEEQLKRFFAAHAGNNAATAVASASNLTLVRYIMSLPGATAVAEISVQCWWIDRSTTSQPTCRRHHGKAACCVYQYVTIGHGTVEEFAQQIFSKFRN
jgi:hypothetical protein